MTTTKITRFQAVGMACSVALVSCLVLPALHPDVSPQCAFDLPATLGSWELLKQGTLQENELKILHASDHWQRVYQRSESKQIVVVTLVVGPSGPLASHQPEVCYARNEFCSYRDASLWNVPNRDDTFRFQTLEPRQVERAAMTIAYAWHDGDSWRAPRVPRVQLSGNSALQRIQITMRHPSGMTHDAQTAMQEFVQFAVEATDELNSRFASRPTPTNTFQ